MHKHAEAIQGAQEKFLWTGLTSHCVVAARGRGFSVGCQFFTAPAPLAIFHLSWCKTLSQLPWRKETGLCCTEAMARRRMFVVFSLGFVGLFLKGKFEHGTGRKQTAHSVLTSVLNRLTCVTAAISVRSRGVNERPTFSDTESEEVCGVRSAAQGLGGYRSALWIRTVAQPFKVLQDVLKPCCKTPYLWGNMLNCSPRQAPDMAQPVHAWKPSLDKF